MAKFGERQIISMLIAASELKPISDMATRKITQMPRVESINHLFCGYIRRKLLISNNCCIRVEIHTSYNATQKIT